MPQVDSTAVDGRGQPFAGAGCDPVEWLAGLHARAVNKLHKSGQRLALQRHYLRFSDCAGWPALALRSSDAQPLALETFGAYRQALSECLADATAALSPPPPTHRTGELQELWQQVVKELELPSTGMLLSQQARLLSLDSLTATVGVGPTWMAMIESRRSLLEQALQRAVGSPRAVVLVPLASEVA